MHLNLILRMLELVITPQIQVSSPSYENLPIVGVSRRGIGATTDTGTGVTVDIEVGLLIPQLV